MDFSDLHCFDAQPNTIPHYCFSSIFDASFTFDLFFASFHLILSRLCYCLALLPNDLSEEIIWFCEDCKLDISKQSIIDEPSSHPSGFSISVGVPQKTVQLNKRTSIFKEKEKGLPDSDTKTNVQTYEGTPSSNETQCKEKCDKDQMLKRKRRLILEDEEDQDLETSQDSVRNSKASNIVEQMVTPGSVAKLEGQMCEGRPFGNDIQSREKCFNEQKLGKERKLVHEDEEAEPLKSLEQRVVTTCTGAKGEAWMCNGRSSSNKSWCMEERDEEQQLKRQQKSSQYSGPKLSNILRHKVIASSMEKIMVQICDGGPFGNTPQSREKCDKYQKLAKDWRLVLSDEKAELVETFQVAAGHHEAQIHDSWRPSNSGPWYRTKCDKYQKFGKAEVQRDGRPSRSEPWYKGGKLGKCHKLREQRNSQVKMKFQIRDSRPYCSEPQHRGKYYKVQTFRKRQRLLLEDEPLETSQNDVGDPKLQMFQSGIIIWKRNLSLTQSGREL